MNDDHPICRMVGPEIRKVLGDTWVSVWTCPECGKERVEPYHGTPPGEFRYGEE